ncbi:MAG: 4Fe-4S binding protein [Methanotrichaceae archaeon]|nr:4Fe-4S binding protein [Methanotrichaceae archaeon]
MVRRKIIKIDESLCNGCGNCIIACSEGAIKVVDGKVRVVSDTFCDGLGACIGECPEGALTIEEREAEDFDEEAAKSHLNQLKSLEIRSRKKVGEKKQESGPIAPCSVTFHNSLDLGPERHMRKLGLSSQLSSWPIQMRLAHIDAPYFKDARLLIAADCSAFACPSISQFIKDKVVLIGCPKLDETGQFVGKLAEILHSNEVKEITVLHMEVPCCTNLVKLVSEAVRASGKTIPVEQFICMVDGAVVKKETAW